MLYERLMDRAKGRELLGYTEKHHVLPKCMGGSNDPSNIVRLTAKEHFMAHKMLVRIHPDVAGLWYALIAMGRIPSFKARIFATERRAAAEARIGFQFSEESRKKMSKSAEARGRNSKKTEFKTGNKPWNAGIPKEQSHRFGKHHSDETKEKLRQSMLKRGIKPPTPPVGGWPRKTEKETLR